LRNRCRIHDEIRSVFADESLLFGRPFRAIPQSFSKAAAVWALHESQMVPKLRKIVHKLMMRQHFLQSGIPDTFKALQSVSSAMTST
jgi:hypothetical protein